MKQHDKGPATQAPAAPTAFTDAPELQKAAAAGQAMLQATSDPFLSAAALGITEADRKGLIMTLEGLESGQIVSNVNFNMSMWYGSRKRSYQAGMDLHSCGTTACLAGWANYLTNGEAFPEVTKMTPGNHDVPDMYVCNTALHNRLPLATQSLFGLREGPYLTSRDQTNANYGVVGNSKEAAPVLREYLTTGRVTWFDEVSKREGK